MKIRTTQAETQLLSHLIADSSLFWTYAPRLKDELFNEYSGIWIAYKAVVSKGESANIITLNKQMGGNSFEDITNIAGKIDYDVDFETWINFLEDEIKLQKGHKILTGLNEILQRNEIEKMEGFLHHALTDLSAESFDHKNMKEHVKDIFSYIENIQAGKRVTGFPTGINCIDNFTGGLQLTDLTIIAAETSMGKTTWTLNIAYNNAINGNYAAIFSLEMSIRQLTSRLLGIDTNISSKEILSGRASLEELNKKLGQIVNNKILLDNTKNPSLESIISKMRFFLSAFKCKLFFIDYLQLIYYHKKGNSTEQNLADICRTLKNFAKENDVSIVLLCQLNRDTGGSTVPKLSRLRGSGQIEECADNVYFIIRPMPDVFGEPEGVQIILNKGRNTGTGQFEATFYGAIPTFQNR